MAKILIIDDERAIRSTLREILEYEDYQVEDVDNGIDGLEMIAKNDYDLVLCDIKMNRMDGLEVLTEGLTIKPDLPFIMISGHGTVETAVEASRKGAFDFISKPPDLNRLLITVRNALDRGSLVVETKVLKRKVSKVRPILGESQGISKIKETIDRVGPTDARVLVTGANGSGKELVARWLHEKSHRSNAPLIEVNCAAIPSELIESELFGHEKGSFTSAVKQRIGKFESASGGTLFLDEIGELPLDLQVKFLRVLQEKEIEPIGGHKKPLNVRVIAATNRDLEKEMAAGRFRLDLYYRLNVFPLTLPPLRNRREDILPLASFFLNHYAKRENKTINGFSDQVSKDLQNYSWPGNVRELENLMERGTLLSTGKLIATLNLPGKPKQNDIKEQSRLKTMDENEREHIIQVLESCNWKIYGEGGAAEILQLNGSTLSSRMKKLGIEKRIVLKDSRA